MASNWVPKGSQSDAKMVQKCVLNSSPPSRRGRGCFPRLPPPKKPAKVANMGPQNGAICEKSVMFGNKEMEKKNK